MNLFYNTRTITRGRILLRPTGLYHHYYVLTQRRAPSGRLRWASFVAHIRALAAPRPRLRTSAPETQKASLPWLFYTRLG